MFMDALDHTHRESSVSISWDGHTWCSLFYFLRIQAEVIQSLHFSTVNPWLSEMKDLAYCSVQTLFKHGFWSGPKILHF